jgi:hypothetical protein
LCDVNSRHAFWTPLAALAAGEGRLSQIQFRTTA